MCQRGSEKVSRLQKCCAAQNEARRDAREKKESGREKKNEPPVHTYHLVVICHLCSSSARLDCHRRYANQTKPPLPPPHPIFFYLSLKDLLQMYVFAFRCVYVDVSVFSCS